VNIKAQGYDLDVPVDDSAITLQVGQGLSGTRENSVSGSITVSGHKVSLPQGDGKLDPNYNRATFEKSFACTPDLKIPVSYACTPFQTLLVQNVARLVIQDLGAMADVVNNDSNCGFAALTVEGFPSKVVGNAGQQGSLTWDISGCGITQTATSPTSTDCVGTASYAGGQLTIDASRTVAGVRSDILGLFSSITPNAPNDVEVDLTHVSAVEYTAYQVNKGASGPQGQLLIHQHHAHQGLGLTRRARSRYPGGHSPGYLVRLQRLLSRASQHAVWHDAAQRAAR
jgi:hypothetical protein